jgi:hypothetical protein
MSCHCLFNSNLRGWEGVKRPPLISHRIQVKETKSAISNFAIGNDFLDFP